MATDLTFTEFTTGTTEGAGVFDQLMRAVTSNIEKEWRAKRLNSDSYGQVYTASIQAAMQIALQYLLEEKRIEAQVDLIKQQTLTEVQQTAKATSEDYILRLEEAHKLTLEAEVMRNKIVGVMTEFNLNKPVGE